MDAEPSPTNFLFCASFCSAICGLRSRSTRLFSWPGAGTQHKAAINNTQTANHVRTTRGCRNAYSLVKQIPPLLAGVPMGAATRRVVIVLDASAADNACMAEHIYK